MVKARYEDRSRNDGQESDRGNCAVTLDDALVSRHILESVAHACKTHQRPRIESQKPYQPTVVLHSSEVQAHQIGEEIVVPGGIPCSVSCMHRIGRVCSAARRSKSSIRHFGVRLYWSEAVVCTAKEEG